MFLRMRTGMSLVMNMAIMFKGACFCRAVQAVRIGKA